MLVRTRGLSFRQAHALVGRVVATVTGQPGGRIMPSLVDESARALFGRALGLTAIEVHDALDPRANVEVRVTRRGPALWEVWRMIETRQPARVAARTRLDGRRAPLAAADRALRAASQALEQEGCGAAPAVPARTEEPHGASIPDV